jgi:hypothetical protein
MIESCEIQIDVYDKTPNPVETIKVIEVTNPSIVKLPEGFTFQQLVDHKKIVFREIPFEIERQVLVVTTKEVPLPEHAQATTVCIDIPIINYVVEWKINEVMYTEGMFVFKNVIVETIVPIAAEKLVHI